MISSIKWLQIHNEYAWMSHPFECLMLTWWLLGWCTEDDDALLGFFLKHMNVPSKWLKTFIHITNTVVEVFSSSWIRCYNTISFEWWMPHSWIVFSLITVSRTPYCSDSLVGKCRGVSCLIPEHKRTPACEGVLPASASQVLWREQVVNAACAFASKRSSVYIPRSQRACIIRYY